MYVDSRALRVITHQTSPPSPPPNYPLNLPLTPLQSPEKTKQCPDTGGGRGGRLAVREGGRKIRKPDVKH